MVRNNSLDVLRILACLGVITIHTAGSPIYHHLVDPGSLWFKECMVMDALVRWCVPVFAMLSGFFLLDPRKPFSFEKLFSKYLARIVIALAFWSLLYALILNKPFIPLGSQEGHFWYLEMLIGLYLSIPILRMIVQSDSLLSFSCFIWLFLLFYSFLGKFIVQPIEYKASRFVEYSGYCLWAFYLKSHFESRKGDKRIVNVIYILGLLGLFMTVIFGLISKNGETAFYSYTSPNVIVTATALFLLFIRLPITLNTRCKLIVEEISKCSFGIYLAHLLVLIQLFSRINRFIPHPLPLCIICVGLVFCGSLVITYLLKRIPVLNKYVV